MEKQSVIDSTGETLELWPVGTRVAHKSEPQLTGTIVAWEYHEGGAVSPLPYKVYWDDWELARKVVGFMLIYPARDEIEAVERCQQ